MSVERRDHLRLPPQSNSFAALGSDYSRVGKIKNISRGGLAFEYIAGESDSRDSSQVDVFMTGDVFHIYSVPCKLIYEIDIHIPQINNKYAKILTVRRCGLKFGDLTEDNLTQLELFLESYATLRPDDDHTILPEYEREKNVS